MRKIALVILSMLLVIISIITVGCQSGETVSGEGAIFGMLLVGPY